MFRSAIRRVLVKILIIRDRAPSTSECEFNERHLKLLLPDTPENRARRLIILGNFTHRWDGTLATHALPGESDSDVHLRLQTHAVGAVFGVGRGNFPSSKFAHCEDALRWTCLLQLLGIYDEANSIFLGMVEDKSSKASAAVHQSQAAGVVAELVDMFDEEGAEHGDQDDADDGEHGAHVAGDSANVAANPDTGETELDAFIHCLVHGNLCTYINTYIQ